MRKVITNIYVVVFSRSMAVSLDAQKLDRAVLAFGSTGPNLTPFWVGRDAGLYRQYGMRSLFLIFLLAQLPGLSWAEEPVECRVLSQFSSQGSVGKTVIDALRSAKERLTIALYGFDNADLGDELTQLVKKGVIVKLKIDTARSKSKKIVNLIDRLKAGGVQVQSVAPNGRNHNKFAVIDGEKVLTGSYNWTLKSENNWENLLILDCPELAKTYETEWERIH
jgi:phosphatidylserine/phosphatidylglycerophosphate/cardiolipin synthase-like enzyme